MTFSLFADNITEYITSKIIYTVLGIKGDFSKAIEYEIKRQMSVAFLYTSNKIRKGNIKKVITVIARQYYRIPTIKPIKDTRWKLKIMKFFSETHLEDWKETERNFTFGNRIFTTHPQLFSTTLSRVFCETWETYSIYVETARTPGVLIVRFFQKRRESKVHSP